MIKKDAKLIAEILNTTVINNSECTNCSYINNLILDLSENFPSINQALNDLMGKKFQEIRSMMFYYELFNYKTNTF
jgi:hypothetical protein